MESYIKGSCQNKRKQRKSQCFTVLELVLLKEPQASWANPLAGIDHIYFNLLVFFSFRFHSSWQQPKGAPKKEVQDRYQENYILPTNFATNVNRSFTCSGPPLFNVRLLIRSIEHNLEKLCFTNMLTSLALINC